MKTKTDPATGQRKAIISGRDRVALAAACNILTDIAVIEHDEQVQVLADGIAELLAETNVE